MARSGWRFGVVATFVCLTVVGCGGPAPSGHPVGPAVATPRTPVAAVPLTRREQLTAARDLRQADLPVGFEHDDRHCPSIGDLAPEFAKYLVCLRTRATIQSHDVDARDLALLVRPLGLSVDSRVTTCAPWGERPYGDAIECTSIGAMHGVPVVDDVLLGSPTPTTVRWTRMKLEVEPSLNLYCPSGNACIVGAP